MAAEEICRHGHLRRGHGSGFSQAVQKLQQDLGGYCWLFYRRKVTSIGNHLEPGSRQGIVHPGDVGEGNELIRFTGHHEGGEAGQSGKE